MTETQIPKLVFQTKLDSDWEVIEKQIERTKIFRFPYKSMIGVSLTNYILSCRNEGSSTNETMARILKEMGILIYILDHPGSEEKLKENIYISISARYAEENMRDR